MFDVSLPDVDALHGADDPRWWLRSLGGPARRPPPAHGGWRPSPIGGRRADGPADCGRWSCDNWDAVAAEVAAAQGISHAMASGQMYLAVALCDRVPKVAALFAEGTISARLASAIVWHTDLIEDPETLRLVDETLAKDAKHFGPLSVDKAAQAVDAIVDRHDPAAIRRSRAGARGRAVVISPADRDSGTASLWGSLYATDAAVG